MVSQECIHAWYYEAGQQFVLQEAQRGNLTTVVQLVCHSVKLPSKYLCLKAKTKINSLQ